MYVGFKRMYIQPLTADNKANGDLIVIEGKQNQGATTTAEITGLSKEATKVAGSDVVYYISRKGVGDVKSDFGVLDMPIDAEDRILGHKVSTSGISYIGSDTEAPYCAVLLESQDAKGDKAELGFFKGTFAKDKENLNTLDPSETYKPEAETYTFSAAASDAEGAQNGQYVARYAGKDEDPAFKEMETQLVVDKAAVPSTPATNGAAPKA
ncbi:phage tail protein [Lacticaseibacillus pabuli]|uniref:Phage tail protein n=1 Tax=Lacticaseibacillus pabuli TaxID=3025672 RepID=A0ABY7WNL6_9LACO|nr:major tail protein [Lacticaseibacillus sp. KACC 23028]WDF81812.1 phage tail protein [Lacticaseibacillus sp. KACC 23028]